MCGPTVACQAACAGKCSNKLTHASQWRYHAGRFLTYGGLGFFAALLSKQIAASPLWPTISGIMLVLAGVMFIASAMPSQSRHFFRLTSQNTFIRGALMGFMPCGLIYAALMMAATLSNPFAGMVAMWMFVLGTLPALLLASGSATLLTQKWQRTMGNIGRMAMAINGLALLALATKMVG